MPTLNATHDPRLTSWVASANGGQTDFPIQNLPFAVFRRRGSAEAWRGGVAIGDRSSTWRPPWPPACSAARPRHRPAPQGKVRSTT